MSLLPLALIAAFRAAEKAEHLGTVLSEDGFDADAMRVLSATQQVEPSWVAPRRPCPDDGRPTAAAWAWLMSGWDPDFVELAQASGVSVPIARKKWSMLASSRLIYPDGSMTKWALAALKRHVITRLGATSKRKGKPGKQGPDGGDKPDGGGDDAN